MEIKSKINQQKFQKWFSSEALLQQAIAGLLTRMPDVTGVQILQGRMEVGKDIVFRKTGGMMEPTLCACVIKNVRITGKVDDSKGARTVLFQAQQALDTPLTNAQGMEESVDRVYVICPVEMGPETILSIQGRVKHSGNSIIFVTGSKLFDLFRKYWPDYLSHEASSIKNYLESAAKEIESDKPLKALAFQFQLGEIKERSRDIYVAQRFFFRFETFAIGKALGVENQKEPYRIPALDPEFFNRDLDRDQLVVLFSWLDRVSATHNLLTEERFFEKDVHKKIKDLSGLLRNEMDLEFKRVGGLKSNPLSRVCFRDHLVVQNLAHDLKLAIFSNFSQFLKMVDSTNEQTQERSKGYIESFSEREFKSYWRLENLAGKVPENVLFVKHSNDAPVEDARIYNGKDSMLIVAPAGHGKTSFCRWNALNDGDEYTQGRSDTLPVYVALYEYKNTFISSFEEMFLANALNSALIIRPPKQASINTIQRIRVYLDGLDEIPDDSQRGAIINLTKQYVQANNHIHVIITARDYIFGDYLDWLPRIHLKPFDKDQIISLAKLWLPQQELFNAFNADFSLNTSINSLMSVPLLATLTILVFRQIGSLPRSVSNLYRIFVELHCGGWDLAKNVLRPVRCTGETKQIILRRIAFRAHSRRTKRFELAIIVDAIYDVYNARHSEHEGEIVSELLLDGLLRIDGGYYYFGHLSFQEFLAAQALLGDPSAEQRNKILLEYLKGDEWWRDVLRFYINLSGNPAELRNWFKTKGTSLEAIQRLDFLESEVNKSFNGGEPMVPSKAKRRKRHAGER